MPVRLIVLHDTEGHDYKGVADLEAVGALFNDPGRQASAHVCVDGEGYSARYVVDDKKAWHCEAYNSASLGIEQIGFATFGRKVWLARKDTQLKKVAYYLAYWSKAHGIPLRRAKVRDGQVIRAGVTTHERLGQLGGGHHDPGPGYPLQTVLLMARYYRRRGW